MRILRIFVLFFLALGLLSAKVMAFECNINNNGVSVIPVDVAIDKNKTEIILTDLYSSSFYCWGDIGRTNKDAIRIVPDTATLNSTLSNAGYTGYFISSSNYKFDFSESGNKCIWYDDSCMVANKNNSSASSALRLQVGVRNNSNSQYIRILSGTEIARFKVQQRGSTISNGVMYVDWLPVFYTFSLVLKSDLVIPAYTCSVDNGELIKVTLPPVDSNVIRSNGIGRYDGVSKMFDLNLTCEPQTSVDVKFDGDTMSNHPDVLKNTVDSTESVGIQVVRNDVSVVFGENKHVIDSAATHETLSYKAHYYYSGGEFNPGPVRSIATVTFDYR